METSTSKIVNLPPPPPPKMVAMAKPRIKRAITRTDKWQNERSEWQKEHSDWQKEHSDGQKEHSDEQNEYMDECPQRPLDVSQNILSNTSVADPKHTILVKDGPRMDNETFSQYFSTFRDVSGNSLLAQQIRQKIAGYRSQDVEKGILDKDAFVTFSYVVELLRQSDRLCYYCQEPVLLLYEYVREPKQWTLERLNNTYGHNEGNVVVACLRCNLKRRCIASERYVKTKQMSNIVKIG